MKYFVIYKIKTWYCADTIVDIFDTGSEVDEWIDKANDGYFGHGFELVNIIYGDRMVKLEKNVKQ